MPCDQGGANPSDLYHQHGIREQVCTRAEYSGKEIILHVETKEVKRYCTHCKSENVIKSGVVIKKYKSVPVGGKSVTIQMKVQRLECKDCGCVCQEHVHFADERASYTHRMKRYVADLCRIGTLLAVAKFIGMSWNTVKEIVKAYLKNHYSKPDLSSLRYIGIDEFAAKKGHVYKTIVVNLETGQIVYVGEGKGADSLNGFWKKLKKAGAKIESVATDLSAAYISAVKTNLPDATYVFDHFHVVKLINEALDKVRKRIVREERAKDKEESGNAQADGESAPKNPRYSIIKGTKYILLRNRDDLTKDGDIERLNAALNLNKDLYTAYYLKEDAKLIWNCDDKQQASTQLADWLAKLRVSDLLELAKLADSIQKHSDGILAYYDKRISTGMVEGINNKIKTLKRAAYGFRDNVYFNLRLLALHDFKVA